MKYEQRIRNGKIDEEMKKMNWIAAGVGFGVGSGEGGNGEGEWRKRASRRRMIRANQRDQEVEFNAGERCISEWVQGTM